MKYQQPFDKSNPDAPYVDGNPVAGIEGSIPRAAAIEHPQREIVALIQAAGLAPYADDLTQLLQGVRRLIQAGIDANRPADIPARALIHFGTATGGGGAFSVAALSPGLPSLDLGTLLEISFPSANTGATTVTLGGFANDATRTLCRSDGSDLRAGDIVAGHAVLAVRADGKLQILGNAASSLFQSFYQQFFSTPAPYWRLDTANIAMPVGVNVTMANWSSKISTEGLIGVNQGSGVVTIGEGGGGTYLLEASGAADGNTTEESLFLWKSGTPIGSGRGPYPSPGSDAMDKSATALIRVAPGDTLYATYSQTNASNATLAMFSSPIVHFTGVRVSG